MALAGTGGSYKNSAGALVPFPLPCFQNRTKMKNVEKLNLQWLLTYTMSDIDTFLLKQEDQKTDKDQLYTKEEIRKQLGKSLNKILEVMGACGYNIKTPLKANWLNISKLAMKFCNATRKKLPGTTEE